MPEQHVCPVWVGYLLASPIRKLFQNPKKMLLPYVREGMTVLDIGSAMGYFSIPMAKMVGPQGGVVCVDLQKKMLEVLMKRARRAGVADRITTHLCGSDSLKLEDYAETCDFALASAVVHESPTPQKLVQDVCEALKPGGIFLVAEPTGHVTPDMFNETLDAATHSGMTVQKQSKTRWFYWASFKKTVMTPALVMSHAIHNAIQSRIRVSQA